MSRYLRRPESRQLRERPREDTGATVQDEAGCHEKLFPSTVTLTSLGLAAHTAQWLKMFTAQTAVRAGAPEPTQSWELSDDLHRNCGIRACVCLLFIYTRACIHVHTPFTCAHIIHTYSRGNKNKSERILKDGQLQDFKKQPFSIQ